MKNKWMQAIGVSRITKCEVICSDHFEQHSYNQTDGYTHIRRLLHNAIPSINLSGQISCTVDIESHQPKSLTILICINNISPT